MGSEDPYLLDRYAHITSYIDKSLTGIAEPDTEIDEHFLLARSLHGALGLFLCVKHFEKDSEATDVLLTDIIDPYRLAISMETLLLEWTLRRPNRRPCETIHLSQRKSNFKNVAFLNKINVYSSIAQVGVYCVAIHILILGLAILINSCTAARKTIVSR